MSYANNDTSGSGPVNLDIRIGPGNPDAIAVRFGGAQLCLLQDLDIGAGDRHRHPDLLLLARSGARTPGPRPSGPIRELTYGLRVENAPGRRESRRGGVYADDDLDVFQAAVDRHETVFVPIGRYLLTDTLKLCARTNLIGLHPRQTWLLAADGHPHFADPDAPRALLVTPRGGATRSPGSAWTPPGGPHPRLALAGGGDRALQRHPARELRAPPRRDRAGPVSVRGRGGTAKNRRRSGPCHPAATDDQHSAADTTSRGRSSHGPDS
ncbi:hypothetical protein ACHZ98_21190 [Streptomyces sp. MAR4 CNY-716]